LNQGALDPKKGEYEFDTVNIFPSWRGSFAPYEDPKLLISAGGGWGAYIFSTSICSKKREVRRNGLGTTVARCKKYDLVGLENGTIV
jgi:hypothetical protein